MSALICLKCKKVPYIEFVPGLTIKIMCCRTLLLRYQDVDKFIENSFTLKCQLCHKKDDHVNFSIKSLICDTCIANKKIKITLKGESIPNTCVEHNKKYEYYDPEEHLLFCEYCDITKNSVKVDDYIKNLKISNIIIPSYSLDIFPCYSSLAKRINVTYEMAKKKSPCLINSYLNLLNLKKFIEEFPIISPLCQICKEIFNINIRQTKESNAFEISCKCGKNDYSSIEELEKEIDTIVCNNCENSFNQVDMFLDFLSEEILCKKCLNERNSFDCLRFNEIAYVCSIHKNKYKFFCDKCGKLICEKCKNLDNHNLVELKACNNLESKFSVFNGSKWFIKLINEGLLNLKNEGKNCYNKNKNIHDEFNKFRVILETKEKNNLKDLTYEYKLDLLSYFAVINNSCLKVKFSLSEENLQEKIANLKEENNRLKLTNHILLKEISEKTKISQFLKTRNILQHLLTKMISKNYNYFENIVADFRILYESYKYLNYEKKNTEEVKKKLESIFERCENLIKDKVKRNEKNLFYSKFLKEKKDWKLNITEKKIKSHFNASDNGKTIFNSIVNEIIPKIHEDKKWEMFNRVFDNDIKKEIDKIIFETIHKYNKHIINQGMIPLKIIQKNRNLITTIKDIENNKLPKDYEKSGLRKDLNLKENDYLDKFGYINDKTFNKYLIKEIFENSQIDENYQYPILKKKKTEEFLKEVNCKNDFEFYFIYILANKLINRIGKIIHQRDIYFQYLFYELNDNFNINDFNLIKDKENEQIKFIKKEKNKINSLKSLDLKDINVSQFQQFIENFFKTNIVKLMDLLGEKKLYEIKGKIEEKFSNIKENDNINNDNLYENKIEKYILFINENKSLFELFPKLKENIINIIPDDNIPFLFNYEDNIKYTKIKEEDNFINMFSSIYASIIYFIKKTNYIINTNKKRSELYRELLEKNLMLELSQNILDLFKNNILNKNDIVDYFEEEKENTVKVFNAIINNKENYISKALEILSETELTEYKMKEGMEIKKIEDMLSGMKNINLKEIGDRFEKYSDFNINSYASTKFDVILFLYQNKYI